jgi:phage-related protein
MAFALDGATTGLASSTRYIYGVFDPQDNMSSTLTVIGTTLAGMGSTLFGVGATIAGMGNTLAGIGVSFGAFGASFDTLAALIGSTQSSFGSTSADPATVFGFLRRAQEMAEGNRAYTKSSGVLDFYSRGSSTLLIEKVITDSTAGTTCI